MDLLRLGVLLVPAGIAACGTGEVLSTTCGNGRVDGGEECDGALVEANCRLLGFVGGAVRCNSACGLDTSACHNCGNRVVDAGEDCDGGVGLPTCASIDPYFTSGDLGCDVSCKYDVAACGRCGDGFLDPSEACDDADLGGATCTSLGYNAGLLDCDTQCQLDDTDCHVCGNGVLYGREVCEFNGVQWVFAGDSCQEHGFPSGELACSTDCESIDDSGCFYDCGDDVADPGEVCDGGDLGGAVCPDFGYPLGDVSCALDCASFDSSCCTFCGNGQRDAGEGEECDGPDLGGETCQTLGFVGGTLACTGSCTLLLANCSTSPVCGDGVLSAGEQCEPGTLGVETCVSVGYPQGGTLDCDAVVCEYAGCTGENCGNGVDDAWDGSLDCMAPECSSDAACDEGTQTAGAPCTLHRECAAAAGVPHCCDEAQGGCPGGACAPFCTSSADCAGGVCAFFGVGTGQQHCFASCTDNSNCRAGYACLDDGFGAIACMPWCTDADCQQQCDPSTGLCSARESCQDGRDNDRDLQVDCDDADCASQSKCQPNVYPDADLGATLGMAVAADSTVGVTDATTSGSNASPSCFCSATGPAITYAWTVPTCAEPFAFTIDTEGSTADTALTIRQASDLTVCTCDSDSGGGWARLTAAQLNGRFPLRAGDLLWITVTTESGGGLFQLNIRP